MTVGLLKKLLEMTGCHYGRSENPRFFSLFRQADPSLTLRMTEKTIFFNIPTVGDILKSTRLVARTGVDLKGETA